MGRRERAWRVAGATAGLANPGRATAGLAIFAQPAFHSKPAENRPRGLAATATGQTRCRDHGRNRPKLKTRAKT